MEHLASRRISCPLPVKDREGRTLKELAGRPAALITFLEGLWVRRPNIEHCAGLGDALAHFHLAGADFPMFRANSLSLPGWRALFASIGGDADKVKPGLSGVIEKELRHLEEHWPDDLPQGVIHADLFPDNVFFLGDKVSGLIDFYFACNDMLAYDVAVCLNAWCFESDGSFNVTKARALLQAYEGVRPLDQARARPSADARARRGAPIPADPHLRSDQHRRECAGEDQGPQRISAQAPLPSAGEVLSRLWTRGVSMAERPKVVIHTDGACSGNPGPGGWGAILESGAASQGAERRRDSSPPITAWS